MGEAVAEWSALPGDILTAVACRLNNSHFDLLRLRAVCSPWRSALPLSLSPFRRRLVVPPPYPPGDFSPPSSGRYAVVPSTVLRLSPLSSPSSSWLVKVSLSDDGSRPNTLSLHNPLTLSRIRFPNPTATINLLDFRVSVIADSYSVVKLGGSSEEEQPVFVKKVVVLATTVLLLTYGGRLQRWSPGEPSWSPIQVGSTANPSARRCYDLSDVVACPGGECYTVTFTGILMKLDPNRTEMEVEEITPYSCLGFSPREDKFLVPSHSHHGEGGNVLYLISKISDPDPEFFYDYDYGLEDDDDGGDDHFMPVLNMDTLELPIKLTVYRLNWKRRDWDFAAGSLGDVALFKGDDVSFSLCAADFGGRRPRPRPSSVYLTDECFLRTEEDEDVDSVYGMDAGLYALDQRLIVSLADKPDLASPFWPPPPWLMVALL